MTTDQPAIDALNGRRDLVAHAAGLVVMCQFGSVSLLQRKLNVGFALAAAVMDDLETLGVVGPAQSGRARDVLIPPDQAAAIQEEIANR